MIQKESLKIEIQRILAEKLKFAQNNFEEAQESVTIETKGSAGDKHETSRAMAQIELENAGKVLLEAERNCDFFNSLTDIASEKAMQGSLIYTNFEIFYISLGLGKIEFEGETIFCLNLNSPIGKMLFGKKVGEFFTFNSKKYEIKLIA
jgi:hypothetical protein